MLRNHVSIIMILLEIFSSCRYTIECLMTKKEDMLKDIESNAVIRGSKSDVIGGDDTRCTLFPLSRFCPTRFS